VDENILHIEPPKDTGFQFSKLYQGSSQLTLIVLVIIIGVAYVVNGSVPDGLLDFAKWIVGGTSATGVAYMIKSGMENKAKAEAPEPEKEVHFVNPEENDL